MALSPGSQAGAISCLTASLSGDQSWAGSRTERPPPPGHLSLMQKPVHWCPEDLPAPPGLSFYLSLPGTAKCATNCLSLSQCQPESPTPTTLASPPKHKSGCGGGVGGWVPADAQVFFGLLQAGRQEDIPPQAITCSFGPLCTHLPKGKIIIVKANMWDKRRCHHFTALVLQAQNSP